MAPLLQCRFRFPPEVARNLRMPRRGAPLPATPADVGPPEGSHNTSQQASAPTASPPEATRDAPQTPSPPGAPPPPVQAAPPSLLRSQMRRHRMGAATPRAIGLHHILRRSRRSLCIRRVHPHRLLQAVLLILFGQWFSETRTSTTSPGSRASVASAPASGNASFAPTACAHSVQRWT